MDSRFREDFVDFGADGAGFPRLAAGVPLLCSQNASRPPSRAGFDPRLRPAYIARGFRTLLQLTAVFIPFYG